MLAFFCWLIHQKKWLQNIEWRVPKSAIKPCKYEKTANAVV